MSHDLTLFGVGTSRTMRAHWMLLELGLDYESRPIGSRSGETLTDEFRRLNLRHKIPFFNMGHFCSPKALRSFNTSARHLRIRQGCICPRMRRLGPR